MSSVKKRNIANKLNRSAYWQTNEKNGSRQKDIIEESTTNQRHQQTMLTGTRFRETLPLIGVISMKDSANSSARDYSNSMRGAKAVIKEEMAETNAPTTFEDYRYNIRSGTKEIGTVTDQSMRYKSVKDSNDLSIKVIRQKHKYAKAAKVVAITDSNSSEQTLQMNNNQSRTDQKYQQQSQGSLIISQYPSDWNQNFGSAMPALNRSISPSLKDGNSPNMQRQLQEQVQWTSFKDYERQKVKLSQEQRDQQPSLAEKMQNYNKRSKLEMMDQLAGTVTLKEGWRKVLLPSLDLTTKNSARETKQESLRARSIQQRQLRYRGVDGQDYEQARIKTVVEEQNVHGRSSVKNLLHMSIEGRIDTLNPSMQTIQHTERKPILLPALGKDTNMLSSKGGTSSPKLPEQQPSHIINTDYHTSTDPNFQKFKQHKQMRNFDKQSIVNSLSKIHNNRKSTLRNSEGYVLYRNSQQPVTRVIPHREASESPVGDKATNSQFTDIQLKRALENKTVARSMSPRYYYDTVAYAPRTIRIFNNNKKDKKDYDYVIKSKAGQAMDKNNIFNSIALKSQKPKAYKYNVTYGGAGMDYASQSSATSLEKHQLQQKLISKTENGSMASLHQSSSSRQSSAKQQHQTLQVENQKNWGPIEIGSRSQVYLPQQASAASNAAGIEAMPVDMQQDSSTVLDQQQINDQKPIITLDNTFASLVRNDAIEPTSYIKVRNEMFSSANQGEGDGSILTTARYLVDQSEMLPEYPTTVQGPSTEMSSKASLHKDATAQIQSVKISNTKDAKSRCGGEVYVANQGTQAIEETSDDSKLENEQDWVQAVQEVQRRASQRIQEEGQGSLLINVESTQLIADQAMLDQNEQTFRSTNDEQLHELLEGKYNSNITGEATNLKQKELQEDLPGQSQVSISTMNLISQNKNSRLQQPITKTSAQKNKELQDPNSKLSIGRGQSNFDIQAVYKDVQFQNALKSTFQGSKGMTSIDFNTDNGFKIDQNQTDFNKSQLFIKHTTTDEASAVIDANNHPPYGFSLQQNDEVKIGLAKLVITPDSPGRTTQQDSPLQLRQARLLPIDQAINPILREAYVQKNKAFKISSPVRKPQEQASIRKKVFVSPKGAMTAAAHAAVVVTTDQGTNLSLTVRGTELIESERDFGYQSTQNRESHQRTMQTLFISEQQQQSKLSNRGGSQQSNNSESDYQQPKMVYSDRKLLNPPVQGLVIPTNSVKIIKKIDKQYLEQQKITTGKQDAIALAKMIQKQQEISYGVTNLKTIDEIPKKPQLVYEQPPKNLSVDYKDFNDCLWAQENQQKKQNLQREKEHLLLGQPALVQSTITLGVHNSQTSLHKSISHQKLLQSNQQYRKSPKPIVTPQELQEQSQNKLKDVEAMFHIQQIVSKHRYDMPDQEKIITEPKNQIYSSVVAAATPSRGLYTTEFGSDQQHDKDYSQLSIAISAMMQESSAEQQDSEQKQQKNHGIQRDDQCFIETMRINDQFKTVGRHSMVMSNLDLQNLNLQPDLSPMRLHKFCLNQAAATSTIDVQTSITKSTERLLHKNSQKQMVILKPLRTTKEAKPEKQKEVIKALKTPRKPNKGQQLRMQGMIEFCKVEQILKLKTQQSSPQKVSSTAQVPMQRTGKFAQPRNSKIGGDQSSLLNRYSNSNHHQQKEDATNRSNNNFKLGKDSKLSADLKHLDSYHVTKRGGYKQEENVLDRTHSCFVKDTVDKKGLESQQIQVGSDASKPKSGIVIIPSITSLEEDNGNNAIALIENLEIPNASHKVFDDDDHESDDSQKSSLYKQKLAAMEDQFNKTPVPPHSIMKRQGDNSVTPHY